ncbi:hypothetical protein ACHAWO_003339 [Cyclotella atomus]|uniref:Uncharacterized protein n=1 Tax=Cyclotella atomus TaxID=382360 RepID=A0ABD3NTW1_9STRA
MQQSIYIQLIPSSTLPPLALALLITPTLNCLAISQIPSSNTRDCIGLRNLLNGFISSCRCDFSWQGENVNSVFILGTTIDEKKKVQCQN